MLGEVAATEESESLLNASTHSSNMYRASTMCQAVFASPVAQFLADTAPVHRVCSLDRGWKRLLK